MLFCTLGLGSSAFSLYQPYIISHGGLSNTQGSVVVTVRILFALCSMLFVEKYIKRTGIRWGVTIACLGTSAAFALFAVSSGFISYSIAAAVSGIAYGLGGMVPVSVMINRWFSSHKSLALGLCSAGSGIATILAPPLFTSIIENVSLAAAFMAEAGGVVLIALVVFALLRNDPQAKGLTPLTSGENPKRAVRRDLGGKPLQLNAFMMLAAILMLGMLSNSGFAHLSVLYRTEGFDSATTALLISFVGFAMTVGKCIYGQVVDRLGGYRASYIFFSLLVSGQILCCLAGNGSIVTAFAAMLCLGLGLPLSTVGLTVFAGDASSKEAYTKTIKLYQTVYMTGMLVFGPFPGMIADQTGSYVHAYMLLVAFAAAAMIFVQAAYALARRKARNEPVTGWAAGK